MPKPFGLQVHCTDLSHLEPQADERLGHLPAGDPGVVTQMFNAKKNPTLDALGLPGGKPHFGQ